MTFEEFQATRRWADDIQAAIDMDLGSDEPISGYHYSGDLHIFAHGDGVFELVIGNDITTSHDLTALERKLYQYGLDDGVLPPIQTIEPERN